MKESQINRDQLEFTSLDEVLQRLDLLLRNGYSANGNWNLAQAAEHLTDWMLFMLDGYPEPSTWMQPMMWAIRNTVGKSMLQRIIQSGKMSKGTPTLSQTVHPARGLDDSRSVQRLQQTIERLKRHEGDFCPSPMFGPIAAEAGLRLQLIHCGHHLNFLQPTKMR